MPRRRLTPEQRKAEILEAADLVLRRNGTAARVEDVVAQAGAAKGTFYTSFPSWDDLLAAIREQQAANTLRHVAPAFDHAQAGEWHQVLPSLSRGFIQAVLEMEGLHDALFHSTFAATRPLPPPQRPTARIAELLRTGNAAGAWQVGDPRTTAVLLFAAIHQGADDIADGDDPLTVHAALDELLARAVAATPQKGPQ